MDDSYNEYQVAALLAGVQITDVLSARKLDDGGLVAVIDNGIAGAPKTIYSREQVQEVLTHMVEGIYRAPDGKFATEEDDADQKPEAVVKTKAHTPRARRGTFKE